MINFKKWFYNTVIGDATLQTYIQNAPGSSPLYNVYPLGIDIQPENFPAITYQDVGFTILSVPRGMHIGRFQVDIWSKTNAIEVENIYTRMAQLFNYENSLQTTVTSGLLWWMREESVTDSVEGTRRLWRKTISYKVWMSNSDLS